LVVALVCNLIFGAVVPFVILEAAAQGGPSSFGHLTDGAFTDFDNDGFPEEWSDVSFEQQGSAFLYADQADLDPNRATPLSPVDTLMLMYDECGRTVPLGPDEYFLVHFMTVEVEDGVEKIEHYVIHIFTDGTIIFFEDGVLQPPGRAPEVEGQRGDVGFGTSPNCSFDHVIVEFQIPLDAAGGSSYSPDPLFWSSDVPPPPPTPPPEEILKCYPINSTSTINPPPVNLTDQFGSEIVDPVKGFRLCELGLKHSSVGPPISLQWKLYFANGTINPPPVLVADQFGNQTVDLFPSNGFLTPALKNGKGNLTAPHWKAYLFNETINPPSVMVADQFGNETVDLEPAGVLFVPALKNGTGTLLAPHWKCYNIASTIDPPPVMLLDQFGNETVNPNPADLLCAMAQKQLVPPPPPPPPPPPSEPALKCYPINGTSTNPPPVMLLDQFGNETVDAGPGVALCELALKHSSVPPPISLQWKLYLYNGTINPPPVMLLDQFGNETADPGFSLALLTPALKNGEGNLTAPHFKAYPINGTINPPPVMVADQFGNETADLGPAVFLFVPALKNGTGTLLAPHWKCYLYNGTIKPPPVMLLDQFVNETVDLGPANLLCAMAQKQLVSLFSFGDSGDGAVASSVEIEPYSSESSYMEIPRFDQMPSRVPDLMSHQPEHTATDIDSDGVPDEADNCPSDFNPSQEDSNLNGIGDACEAGVVHSTAAFLHALLDGNTTVEPTPLPVVEEPELVEQITRIVEFRVDAGLTDSATELTTNLIQSLVDVGLVEPDEADDLLNTVLEEIKIVVQIDIKPGSFPNAINPNSRGVIPVAILTTDSFDASTVDASTVRFGPDEAPAVKSAMDDVDNDGDLDMILFFRTQQTGIACGQTSATLTGQTLTSIPIEGSDSIKTVACK